MSDSLLDRGLDEVTLLDEDARPIGRHDRVSVHGTDTPLHLAFSVHVVDDDGRVLVTRRALGKVTWPGVWTNSCCGHPRPGEDLESAVRRRVREELGLELDWLRPALPDFRYRATDASGIVENEVCPVFVARALDTELHPDADEVMEYAWLDWSELVSAAAAASPVFSPWATMQLPLLDEVFAELLRPEAGSAAEPLPDADPLRDVDAALARAGAELAATWARLDIGDPVDLTGAGEDLPGWLQSTLLGGGKRFRATLAHWGFEACGGSEQGRTDMVTAAAALEMLHCFALIHDDVMDDSDSRRGRPSAHVQAAATHKASAAVGDSAAFGRNQAILLGDLAHAEADRLAAGLPEPLRRFWHELKIELIAGQRADLSDAASGTRDFAQARRVARLKSGAYTVERPLLLGALAARASARQRDALTRYGRHVGDAFAYRDDYLGVWGEPAVTGKPAGDDLRLGKATIILALAEEALSGEAHAALLRLGTPSMTESDVEVVREALVVAGIDRQVEALIADSVDAARRVLAEAAFTPAGSAGLALMVERVAWRQK